MSARIFKFDPRVGGYRMAFIYPENELGRGKTWDNRGAIRPGPEH
jgi:hypothetical protein